MVREDFDGGFANGWIVERAEGEIAKKQTMSGWWPLVGERAFHFKPIKGHSGQTFRRRVGIAKATGALSRFKESAELGPDGFAFQKVGFEFVDGGFYLGVELIELTKTSRDGFRKERDGFAAASD